MKQALTSSTTSAWYAAPFSFLDRLAKHAFLSFFQKLQYGKILLIDRTEHYLFGGESAQFPMSVTVQVHNSQFYKAVIFGGDVGAGEAYINGLWSCDDLTALVRIMVRNRHILDTMDKGWATSANPARKVFHALRRNTREGSRRNIAAHYDLGNDFFELFLDNTMMYSCAIFEQAESSLHEASIAKNDRICRKLNLAPHDQVLEIGAGWGGFAIYAAQHYGCHVTTTTISKEQYHFAQQRITAAGLTDRIRLLQQDYRELQGQYDKLVSIEMIEAVGHQYLGAFFQCCSNLLKANGSMLLQSITIADHLYERAKKSVDFIKQYIFPGSFIPSVTTICNALTCATDLRLFHLEDQGQHYATTLRRWRERLLTNQQHVAKLGYSDTFLRMWEYYFCYCEGGFLEGVLSDVQIVLTKPLCRRAPIQPPLP